MLLLYHVNTLTLIFKAVLDKDVVFEYETWEVYSPYLSSV